MKPEDKRWEVVKLILGYWISTFIRDDSKKNDYLQAVMNDLIDPEKHMMWERKFYSIRIYVLDSGKVEILIGVYGKKLKEKIKVLRYALESAQSRGVHKLENVQMSATRSSVKFTFSSQGETMEKQSKT